MDTILAKTESCYWVTHVKEYSSVTGMNDSVTCRDKVCGYENEEMKCELIAY